MNNLMVDFMNFILVYNFYFTYTAFFTYQEIILILVGEIIEFPMCRSNFFPYNLL